MSPRYQPPPPVAPDDPKFHQLSIAGCGLAGYHQLVSALSLAVCGPAGYHQLVSDTADGSELHHELPVSTVDAAILYRATS